MPTIINPVITDVGLAAAIEANGAGLQLAITHIALGTGQYTPANAQTALTNRTEKVTIGAGTVSGVGGFRVSVLFPAWTGAPNPYNATEIGFYAGDPDAGGVLFAVYSHVSSVIVQRNALDYVASFGLQLSRVPSGSIAVTIDAAGAQSLALIAAHEEAADPHAQYEKKVVGGDQFGLFDKSINRAVAWVKTGSFSLSTASNLALRVNGVAKFIPSATAVTMPAAAVAGTDYAIWANPDGTLQATADLVAPPVASARLVGGFHYGLTAPGTTVAGGLFATAGNGMIWTQGDVDKIAGIDAWSFWDLKWRCKGEQAGMALDPYTGAWAAIYWCSTNHIANGISKYNTDVASGTVLPRIPLAYGGNGVAAYPNMNWWTSNEIANSHGLRLPTEREFVSAAFGVTENQSLGGAAATIPSTARQPGYTSKLGLEQATGHIWTWGADSSTRWDGVTPGWAFRDVNGGRGQVYLYADVNLVRVLLGGYRSSAAFSGSRASNWYAFPWNSYWSLGLRAFGDHLVLD